MENEAEYAVGSLTVYVGHNISPPQPLDLRNSGEAAENFKLSKEKYNIFYNLAFGEWISVGNV